MPPRRIEPRLSAQAQEEIERGFDLKREAIDVLDLIVAEFNSDPMSVQCFDLRTVQRAKDVVREIKALRQRSPFAGL